MKKSELLKGLEEGKVIKFHETIFNKVEIEGDLIKLSNGSITKKIQIYSVVRNNAYELVEDEVEDVVEVEDEVDDIPFSEYQFDSYEVGYEVEDLFNEQDIEYSQHAIDREEDTETIELLDSINQELLKSEILTSELIHEVFDEDTDNAYIKYVKTICKYNRSILVRTCKYITKLEKYFKEDFTGLNWMTINVDTMELEFYYTLEEVVKNIKKIG